MININDIKQYKDRLDRYNADTKIIVKKLNKYLKTGKDIRRWRYNLEHIIFKNLKVYDNGYYEKDILISIDIIDNLVIPLMKVSGKSKKMILIWVYDTCSYDAIQILLKKYRHILSKDEINQVKAIKKECYGKTL